jgi:hypothetical protein
VTATTTLDSSKFFPGCAPYPGGYTYKEGGRDVHDQFDVTLEDADLLGEVELTTNLIIAASEADEHMTTAEIDRILGVRPRAS